MFARSDVISSGWPAEPGEEEPGAWEAVRGSSHHCFRRGQVSMVALLSQGRRELEMVEKGSQAVGHTGTCILDMEVCRTF